MAEVIWRDETGLRRSADAGEAFGARGAWLFVNPHDDDAILGAGMLIQEGVRAGVDVGAAVTTDGRMGYLTDEHRETIAALRREETAAGYRVLGLGPERIFRFEYPDANLHMHLGRRRAREGDLDVRAGHTGVLNSLVWAMREMKPAAVFINTPTDVHPDHRMLYDDAVWAAVLCGGAIWPELGRVDFPAPAVYEYMVYCPFSGPPTHQLRADDAALERKLESLSCFRSQGEIGGLAAGVRRQGPVEYFRRVDLRPADLEAYARLFE